MAPKSPKGAGQADDTKRGLSRRQVSGGGQRLAGRRAGERGRRAAGRRGNRDGQRRQFAARHPGMDEGAGRSDGKPAYGMPSPFENNLVKNISKKLPQYISAAGRTPLQDLDGIITPNGLFYERHHGGVPAIDPEQHRLMLHGLVDRP